jgi:1-acyl-sn-glycerol-3-phosphate acyltransferase
MAAFTIVMSAWLVVASLLNSRREFITFIIQSWSHGLCWMAGIRIHASGLEKIPSGGVLYIFNHQSHLDIPVVHWGIPRDFRFGAKSELFKIPVFSRAMRRAGALEIPRFQRSQAVKVLEDAERRIKGGESFILAPEGTRQEEAAIGEFRSGPFVVAIKAQAPLVPVVLKGVEKVLPKGTILMNWKSFYNDVQLQILDPIKTSDFSYEKRDELKAMVRERFIKAYERS